MKIVNNNKVQGIFVYSPDSSQIEFTKDDLVISGSNIYICIAESVSGIDPADDTVNEYYQPYPGSKIITASEFFQYVESGGEIVDKYVSSQALTGILQGYQFGLSMTGVVTDYIDKTGKSSLNLSTISEYPLDNLMLSPDLNRGIIKVSHNLSQIVDGELNGIPFSTLFGYLEKDGIDYNLVLNQYTYKPGDTTTVRIQEMCCPLTGVSIYRYMSWEGTDFPSDGNVISSWRNVYSYSSAIMDKMNALSDYYSQIGEECRSKVDALRGRFRFKEMASSYGYSVEVDSGIYTICVMGLNSENHNISESITLKTTGAFSIYFGSLPGCIKVTSLGDSRYKIALDTTSINAGVNIISVYGRDSL